MVFRRILAIALFLHIEEKIFSNIKAQTEINYEIEEDNSLEFPITQEELSNWETHGTSILVQNKAIIVPELKDKKGALNSQKFISDDAITSWNFDVVLDIGNEDKTRKGGNGVGIYYLETFNREDVGTGIFGFSKNFKGLGIYLNTILQVEEEGEQFNYVQGFVNDGS